MSLPSHAKVLVIGGGPAGSTSATFLAREGIDVTLVDKAVFPRYHIGESLIPSCLEILTLMGARDLFDSHGFQRKPGAYFNWKGETWVLDFGELAGSYQYAYQVRREEFDHLLLQHAREQGVNVCEGITVRDIGFDNGRPTHALCASEDGTLKTVAFDYVIDASGRTGLMATRYLKSRRFHDVFKNVAVWGYWEGLTWPETCAEGAILVSSIPDGWWWAIPLAQSPTSIGMVLHRDAFIAAKRAGSLEQVYEASLKLSPVMKQLTGSARLVTSLRTEQDYSYTCDEFAGEGFFLAGDAACFLDPLLSTGVHLAMYSGMLAAASVASIVRAEIPAAEAAAYYRNSYRAAYLRYLLFVQTFYESHGKLGYYSAADKLSHYAVDVGDINLAFLNLVSGLEDIADAEQATAHLMGQMARRIDENLALRKDKRALSQAIGTTQATDNAQFFDVIEGLPCLSQTLAFDGLYVSVNPRLGLRRVDTAQ